MTTWHPHLRRARFAATMFFAGLVIAAAIAMGVAQLALPVAAHYPDFIARQLSARLHRPVKLAAIRSKWQPSGPLLSVTDLTLGPGHPGGQSITLPHATLKFHFGAWLHPGRRWITLRLKGMELQLEHSAAGWRVVGFGGAVGKTHARLQSLPVNLDLSDLRVDIVDDVSHRSWHLFAPRMRVVNIGNSVRFGGSVEQSGTREAVAISGRMDAAARDYDLYVVTHHFNFAEAVRGLDLHGYVVRSGEGDVQLWGRWRHGKLTSAAARYTVKDLAMSDPERIGIHVASLSGTFRAGRVKGGWNLAWRGPGKPRADIDQAGGVRVQLRGHRGAWQVSAAARDIDMAPWLSLLAMAPGAPKTMADWAARAQPHLRIDSAAATWREHGPYDATIRFSKLYAAATPKIPGITLARGTFRADQHALSLELPRQAATLALTNVFRKPFVLERFNGTFVAWRREGLWNIAAAGMQFDTGQLAGSGRARLIWLGHGKRPFVSAYAAITRAAVSDSDRFWPYRHMAPKLVAWLDHALVGGKVTSGRVLIRGGLDDWPFLDHQGRFEATGAIHDATFDFSDKWPRATGVNAAVDFVDNRLGIVATHATVAGVTTNHAVAAIPDLHHGVLGLDIRGSGTGAELLGFVRHSPVGKDAVAALEGVTVGGRGKFAIRLSIPLHDAAAFSLDGKVDLAHADVTAPKWKLALKDVTGPLEIDNHGFRAQGLTAMFRGAPAKLAMAVGSHDVRNPNDVVEASMDTRVSAETLVQGYPDLGGLVQHASGVAPFHIGVRVVKAHARVPATTILAVRSSLAGIALDLPAPLTKPADTKLPLRLRLEVPPAGAPLTVSLGDVLQVRGRLADPARHLPTALAIRFGRTLPESVPARGLVVTGHPKRLDVGGWIEQTMGSSSGAAFPQLTKASITTDAAEVFGTDLGALDFSYRAGAQRDTITLEGKVVKGTIEVPTTDLASRGITADFQHLYWPAPPPSKHSGPPAPPSASSPIAPAAVPPLHVNIADLKLANAQLGETLFQSAPTAHGMRIDKFESKGADFSIHAHGNWDGTRAASHSQLVIDVASRDFGKTLAAFGFSGLLAGGEDSRLHVEGTWPGAPSSFSLAWMNGTLGFKIGAGRLLAVKPGLGRLLGLLSLRQLPSRLLLHFGDVFKSGFGFNKASATFTLKDGNAYTHDLLIAAPAARITMHGHAGFRARDFDLVVDVTPHVGGTLPFVGAVVGGPVGAAAGLVMQGLIGKGINEAAERTYRVTGSWDKPKIVEVTGSTPAPASGGSAAPAATASAPASTGRSPGA